MTEQEKNVSIAKLNSEINQNTATCSISDNFDNSLNDLTKLKVQIAAGMLCKFLISFKQRKKFSKMSSTT